MCLRECFWARRLLVSEAPGWKMTPEPAGVVPLARYGDKVAVITGGTSGIGLATAARLLSEGARVVVAGRDAQRGRSATEALAAIAGADRVVFQATDVTDDEQLALLFEVTQARFERLDLLVNAAGAIVVAPFAALGRRHWQRALDVNLTSVFVACQLALPLLGATIEQGLARGAAIVNVTSLDAVAGDAGMTAYSAAKAGALNFTRSLALELAPQRIRVNSVAPGAVDTPMTVATTGNAEVAALFAKAIPLGRFAFPEEIAAAVAFLGADEASFITGTNLLVDGGVTCATGHPNLLDAFGYPS